MVEGTPPGDALPQPPQRATPARKGARCGAGAGSPRPHRPHPGHTGRGTLAARSRGRAAGEGTAPDNRRPSQRWQASPPWGRPPTNPAARSPHRACRPRGQCWAPTSTHPRPGHVGGGPQQPAPLGRQSGEGQRLTSDAPHNGRRHPPRGRPSATPTASNAGPQGRTLFGRCWVPTPAPTAPGTPGRRTLAARSRGRAAGGGTAPDTRRPSQRWQATPPGDALPPRPQRATPARKGACCGTGAGSQRPHRAHPGHTGRGTLVARSRGRAAGGGTAPDTRRPSQRWQATPPGDGLRPPPRYTAPTGHAGQGDSVGPPHPHTRTHSTWVAGPNGQPSGRAVRGGTAPDLRRPSQWWKVPPPGTPFCHLHSEQRRPARAQTVGPVLSPHARTDRNRDTGSRNPGCPLQRTGTWGVTVPDTGRPSQRWQAPPPEMPFRHPHSEQRRPARAHAVGPVLGPHARTDGTRDTRVAEPWLPAPEDGLPEEGQRLTPGAPHNGGRPAPPWTAPHRPRGTQPPQGMQAKGTVLGPHTHTPAPTTRGSGTPTARPVGEQSGEGQRLTPGAPHNGGRHPPGGAPFRHPHSEQRRPARAHAVGPVLGPHACTDRTRDTRVEEPWLPAPEDGRPGEGQRLTPGAPHNGGRPPPPGTAPDHPRGTQPPQGMQARGIVLRPHTHTPAPTARG